MPRHIDRSRCAAAVALAMLAITLAVSPAAVAQAPHDPLQSGKWADLVVRLLGDRPVVMDERVKVHVPSIVENQAQVPVSVDARAIDGVTRLVVFADYNPIEHVLTMSPAKAEPYVGFRMKVEQGTPVRAAALGADGKWHVGSVFLEAAGGGCSSPALARRDRDWSATVGQAQGRVWRQADGSTRVRLRVRHPMDTGLGKDNTPPYYIETVTARSAGGEVLATLETFQPVGEDPTLTLIVHPGVKSGSVEVESRDNNGGLYHATIAAALTE